MKRMDAMGSGKFIYQCTGCGKEYSSAETVYLCPGCSLQNTATAPPRGVLKTLYDYNSIRKGNHGFKDLEKRNFLELLPIESCNSLPGLRVGNTPLYTVNHLNGHELPFLLHLKDDSQNPTFSFKDRASALVSAYAKEKNFGTLVAASTGNAGSSLAGICASQGQQAVVLVPETAPPAKLIQIMMYGATIIPIQGTYDAAFDLSIEATRLFGWYNRNTAFNPLTIEGKKTVSFELYKDLSFRVPDRIFVPVGDGVIISGVYKGFEELFLLGITHKMPVIVAVQSEGSDNLVRNIGYPKFEIVSGKTIADSISVDIPRNFFMAQQYILKYGGETIALPDQEILEASVVLARNSGIFAEPAAATAFAGLLAYEHEEKIGPESDNVVLLTGSGLKDLNSVSQVVKMPGSIYPSVDELQKLFR